MVIEKLKTISGKSLKLAGAFAYILIAVNMISGLLIAPFIMRSVGQSVYGVYASIASFSAVIGIVDIGITQTLIRYIANYNASKRSIEEIASICKIGRVINYGIIIVSLVFSAVMYNKISSVYGGTFNISEIKQAKIIFIGFAVSYLITLFTNYYTGIISGYGYFLFINISKCTRIAVRVILVFLFLNIIQSIYMVLIIDVVASAALLIAEMIYVEIKFKIPYKSKFPGKKVCREIIVYTSFIFLTIVVDQINNNLDNIFIGALVGATAVTVYSFGLSIFQMFQSLSSSISQMLIPHMADRIALKASNRELEDDLIRIGRIQYVINGGVMFGFIAIGKLFISLWLGDGFENVWIVSIILMTGAIFPLIQNGAIAILKARNLLAFRTVMTVLAALVNGILTFFLVKKYGYIYASVGTAAGFLIINTVIMDIYYSKKLGLNMLRVLFNIMKRITLINVVVLIAVRFLSNYLYQMRTLEILHFLICGVVYVVLYAVLLYLIELKKEERKNIKERFGKNV